MKEVRYAENKLMTAYDQDEWWKRMKRYEVKTDDVIAMLHVLDGKLRLYGCDKSAEILSEISLALLSISENIGPMSETDSFETELRTAYEEIGKIKVKFYKELYQKLSRVS
jgi:hypothetical protein